MYAVHQEGANITNKKIWLIGQKIETLFTNWGAEINLAVSEPQHVLESMDAFYQPYTHRYIRKRTI